MLHEPSRPAPACGSPREAALRDTSSDIRSDTDLVALAVGGEQRAFAELVGRYQTRLLDCVYRMIGDWERAEDLVQETFVRVHVHLTRFDRSRRFSPWIYAIATNLARSELRSRARSSRPGTQRLRRPWGGGVRPGQVEDARTRPDVVYFRRRLRALVDDAITRLPANERAVFVLRDLDGLGYAEIAAMVGCPVGTVKSRLNRARGRFATIIEPSIR